MDVDYVAALVDVGKGKLGDLAVSYFDEKYGGYGVGTRRFLSAGGVGSDEHKECEGAFQTLQELQAAKRLSLPFELDDPCQKDQVLMTEL